MYFKGLSQKDDPFFNQLTPQVGIGRTSPFLSPKIWQMFLVSRRLNCGTDG
jgi:hypothetical protein